VASLQELAEHTGRAPGILSRVLRTMERYGLVRLHKGARGAARSAAERRAAGNEPVLSDAMVVRPSGDLSAISARRNRISCRPGSAGLG